MVTSYYTREYGGMRETNAAIARRNAANRRTVIRRSAPRATAPAAPAKPSLSPEARTSWEQAIAQYAPGGGFGRGVEAGIERGATKAVSSGMQSLVSAGLAGTTQAAGLGKKYEEEIAMPARERMESARATAISSLKAGFAGALQRGEETAADRALRERLGMANVNLGYASMETSGGSYGGGGGYAPQPAPQQPTTSQHVGQISSPFASRSSSGGGYSPPMEGFGGGMASPLAKKFVL